MADAARAHMQQQRTDPGSLREAELRTKKHETPAKTLKAAQQWLKESARKQPEQQRKLAETTPPATS